MHRPTVGIDLGAAYTKMSYRAPFPPQTVNKFVAQPSRLLTCERSILFPSLVLWSPARGWICGPEAARLTPGTDWRAFENWKAALFGAPQSNMVEVVTAFFSYAGKQLARAGAGPTEGTLTRVSLPAFKDTRSASTVIRSAMIDAGWIGEIEIADEPRANVIGTFSGGRNVVSASGDISFGPMFGPEYLVDDRGLSGIFAALRRYALKKGIKGDINIVVVDCGGYTLDVANVTIDLDVRQTSFPTGKRATVSTPVGIISKLDHKAIDALIGAHHVDGARVPFRSREAAKEDLYAGKPHELIVKERAISLGKSKTEKNIVKDALDGYADEVWTFVQGCIASPEIAIITGGGTEIRAVRDSLARRLKTAVQEVRFAEASTNRKNDDAGNDGRLKEALASDLGRTATALGAGSIALGFVPDRAAKAYTPKGVFW